VNEYAKYLSIPESWLDLHEMKKYLIMLALLVLLPLFYLIPNHRNYGEALPPGLPADIPVVAGQIISGRRTLFEDGAGYVVDIRSDLSYDEVVNFYATRYGNVSLTDAPGMGEEFSVADVRLGSKRILLEIHSRESSTYVTMAIHLGKWW
jgi:hypothetical protein